MAAGMTTPEMLRRLVAFDTTSAKSNLAIIDFIRDYLAAHGIACRLTPSADGDKANLFATIGPEIPGGIVLSGHTDVVPVVGQPWDSDPFAVVERGGKLYGRGTSDMKGFIAAVLVLVPEMINARLRLPLHFAFSYDEELGCLGVGDLIQDVVRNLPRPAICLIGEPTLMQLVNRHKGVYSWRTTVTGKDGHSSAPQHGVNAIAAAAEIVAWLVRQAESWRRDGPFDDSFEPPYATGNIGEIRGGTAINIIARECVIDWEFRPIPGVDANAAAEQLQGFIDGELLPRLRKVAPACRIETVQTSAAPPLRPEADSPAEALIRHLTGANQAVGVAYGTEGGLFQAAEISTVVCGPGSIQQAHQPNEFIALEQLQACDQFLRRLLNWARA
jgi:acetylornithine deacetylase